MKNYKPDLKGAKLLAKDIIDDILKKEMSVTKLAKLIIEIEECAFSCGKNGHKK